MEEKLKKFKYLVTVGCSFTYGQNCNSEYHFTKLLAEKLNLELINLSVPSTGWYHVETIVTQFIHNNQDKIKDCFFILQISQLSRRVNEQEIPIVRSDFFEKYGIRYLSQVACTATGFWDWDKFLPNGKIYKKPKTFNTGDPRSNCWVDEGDLDTMFRFFPEHRHYPNRRNPWMIDGEIPPNFEEKFQEYMLQWAKEFYSFHLFLENMGVSHIIVDGYSPFMSYKLNFKNYYQTDDEFEFVKLFWSKYRMTNDEDDIYLYDFPNIKAGWILDKIPEKNKIEDVVLFSLLIYNAEDPLWTPDGGHAGPKGMAVVYKTLYKILKEKNWF